MGGMGSGRGARKLRPALRGVEERNRLVEANAGLVFFVVKGLYASANFESRMVYGDAVCHGFDALLRAAELFDERFGVKFSTYACRCIRLYVLRKVDALPRAVQERCLVSIDPGTARLRDRVREALEQLRPEQKELIEQRHFQGRQLRELAREQGCSRQTISARTKRAEAALRQLLLSA